MTFEPKPQWWGGVRLVYPVPWWCRGRTWARLVGHGSFDSRGDTWGQEWVTRWSSGWRWAEVFQAAGGANGKEKECDQFVSESETRRVRSQPWWRWLQMGTFWSRHYKSRDKVTVCKRRIRSFTWGCGGGFLKKETVDLEFQRLETTRWKSFNKASPVCNVWVRERLMMRLEPRWGALLYLIWASTCLFKSWESLVKINELVFSFVQCEVGLGGSPRTPPSFIFRVSSRCSRKVYRANELWTSLSLSCWQNLAHQCKLDLSFQAWPGPADSMKWPWASLHQPFPALDLLLPLLAEEALYIPHIHVSFLPN